MRAAPKHALDWLGVILFAGLVFAILAVAAAIVAWSWGLHG